MVQTWLVGFNLWVNDQIPTVILTCVSDNSPSDSDSQGSERSRISITPSYPHLVLKE